MTMGIVNAKITVDLGSPKAHKGKSTPSPIEDHNMNGRTTTAGAKNTHA
jgi:hypothetical protein